MGLIDYGAHSTQGNIVRVSWETHLRQGFFGTPLPTWSGTDWRWPWQGSTLSRSNYFDISPWGAGWYTGDLLCGRLDGVGVSLRGALSLRLLAYKLRRGCERSSKLPLPLRPS